MTRLHPDDVRAIAREVAALVSGPSAPVLPVLTVAQAMELTGKRSASALSRWMLTYAPKAKCGHGRFTRSAVLVGLEKEARQRVEKRRAAP